MSAGRVATTLIVVLWTLGCQKAGTLSVDRRLGSQLTISGAILSGSMDTVGSTNSALSLQYLNCAITTVGGPVGANEPECSVSEIGQFQVQPISNNRQLAIHFQTDQGPRECLTMTHLGHFICHSLTDAQVADFLKSVDRTDWSDPFFQNHRVDIDAQAHLLLTENSET